MEAATWQAHRKDIGDVQRLFIFSRMSHILINIGKHTVTTPWSFNQSAQPKRIKMAR